MPCRPPIRSRTARSSGSPLLRNFAATASNGASSVIATESVAVEPSALKSGSSKRADGGAASAVAHTSTHSTGSAIHFTSVFIASSRTGAVLPGRRRGPIHDLVCQVELLARHAQRFHHLITRSEPRVFLTLAPYVCHSDDQCQ